MTVCVLARGTLLWYLIAWLMYLSTESQQRGPQPVQTCSYVVLQNPISLHFNSALVHNVSRLQTSCTPYYGHFLHLATHTLCR